MIKKILFAALFSFFVLYFINLSAQEENRYSSSPMLIKLQTNQLPAVYDDGDLPSLRQSLDQSILFYTQLPQEKLFYFGDQTYTVGDLCDSLKHLKKFIRRKRTKKALSRFLKKEFDFYRSKTLEEKGVTFSSYYEYGLTLSLERTEEFHYPLYSRPKDLIDVSMENFNPAQRGERLVGRLVGNQLVPYYTREEIDSFKTLQGSGLEIAWAKDPLEILFLQIQGSGWFSTPSGQKYHIRYAADNGKPYHSVGLALIENGLISKEGFSRQWMIDYLSKIGEEKRQMALNQNPRYVFFEIVSDTIPIRGALSVPITAGRSVAADPKVYPQGALAWISTEKPSFDSTGKKTGSELLSRLVLNQDEGGAIKGINRIDFFSGRGDEAKKMAENLWYRGEIYFLVKKKKH